MHYAASNGNKKVGDILIKNGTDVDAVDKNGQTALHVAAKKSKSKILSVLIANGADADIADDKGKTALHFAAKKGWWNDQNMADSILKTCSIWKN